MENKITPLNHLKEFFWTQHFKQFAFIGYFLSQFVDLLKDQMKSPELSVSIAGLYIIGLNISNLGIYKAFALCQHQYPDYMYVPDALLLVSPFSVYSHHFYPLTFIGNLQKSPYFITVICALYCYYDFILILIDVFIN